jgi:predicted acyltransferase
MDHVSAMTADSVTSPKPAQRIVSIDQLRGYAILGMLVVNYFGGFSLSWSQLHHHKDYMTYADTIAPLFLFVVGMTMRLSMVRRIDRVGLAEARRSALKRYALLTLIAFAIYAGYLWDALMDIGLAGLLAILVIDKKPSVRIFTGVLLLAAYQLIFSFTSYGGWLLGTVDYTKEGALPFIFKLIPLGPELVKSNINGGPIGPLSWCFMLLCGTVAYDLLATRNTARVMRGCLAWGAALFAAGLILRLEWPGIKAAWPFSQYWMTVPFVLWSSGLCFLTLLAFYALCDVLDIRVPHLTVLGQNPLFIYILQYLIMDSAERFLPEHTSFLPGVLVGFAVFYAACYGSACYLHQKGIIVKL